MSNTDTQKTPDASSAANGRVSSGTLLAAFGADELVFWSFRYFLGRRTIATCDFAERLAKGWPHITSKIQALIQREIEEAFAKDDEMRANPVCSPHYYPLGDYCDRMAWKKVRDVYSANTRGVPDARDH